jgi:hypothetical protein
MEGLPTFVQDKDEDEWAAISAKAVYSGADIQTMQEQAEKLYYTNPIAGGLIDTMVNFIVGKDATVTPVDEDPKVAEYWWEFYRENKLDERIKEMVSRALRAGEFFLRFFEPASGRVQLLRFVEPSEIKDNSGTWQYGIESDEDDIETPINYFRTWTVSDGVGKGTLRTETIAAEEILHFKILVDSNVQRGVSFLTRVAPWIKKYEIWLNDRWYLNKIRSVHALIKKITGDVNTFSNNTGQAATARTGQVALKKKIPPSGSVIIANKGTEYEYANLNINATDTKEDGRAFLLMIVCGSGMAEYMVTGDASNANYSSTMVAESPAVKAFESWQDKFAKPIEVMYRKAIQYGIDKKEIPATTKRMVKKWDAEKKQDIVETIESPTSLECKIDFATLISRNAKEETEALNMQRVNGWVSDRTASSKLGYDWDEEQEELAREEAKNDGQERPPEEDVIPPEDGET